MFNLGIFNTQPPHLFFGGVERRIMELSKRLSGKVNITVYCGTKAGFREACNLLGVKMVPCFSTDLFFPVDNWFFNRSILRDFDRMREDVYEVHTVSGYGVLKALSKCRIKKPLIEVVHGVLADEYAQVFKGVHPTLRTRVSHALMRYMSRLEMELAQKATLVVTISNYSLRKVVELYGVEEEKVRIVPNGVDSEVFKPVKGLDVFKKSLGIKGKHCVLFVGNLIPRKGVHFLIEAAQHVVKNEGNVVFLVVGDGPLRNFLISYSVRLGVRGNFIFLGRVHDGVLPLIYNCADVFVLPSLQEGQGIALLEAQASAKPVVAFDVGGVGECVKHGETGLLVEPDSFELGEAILKLLRDESLRARMGITGRRFVCENFSWDVYAGRMFKVYLEALEH
ncbi:MAG: glycosyltransferase family 4 protein [Candidatus Bathyarchaeota archaeon]|jgi:glycosyltransferase involved in cell wall biosynthesis|nr:glycosyltransferase family 4 protein [Candidatus Bathyarchaeota archaeon]